MCAIARRRPLRGGQSGVIGLIVRDLSAPFYAELTAGLTEALGSAGTDGFFCFTAGKDGEQLAQRFSLLLNQGVDGVVIAGAAGSSDDLRRMAEEKAIPVIFASRASYLDDVDTVRPDNMQAAQLLTEHLIRNGHQRIAWLGGQSSSLTRAERVGGYWCNSTKIWPAVS
ncbi:Repressor of malXY [Escherichia coli]|nr:Repressor of malXY [Escherichia coli]